MPRLLYSLLLYVLLPPMLLRLVWRARGPAGVGASGSGLAERLGYVARADNRPVVVHCVSVGETLAAAPLIEALLERQWPLWLTSTTFTGAAQVGARFGGRVAHSFLPMDTPGAVARFLDRVKPRAVLVMETEIWPNLVAACRARGIPVLLVNARLSEKSARGYARLGQLTRNTLNNFSLIAAQADSDAARFRALGASQVVVTGNLKFDQPITGDLTAQARRLRESWGDRPVWIAASTHAGEDEIVLAANRILRQQFPDLLLILVPRHPERFDAVAVLASREANTVRRSAGATVTAETRIYLGDTMGELNLLFATADVAFIGGSFSGTGGHNFLEPAALGVPVCSGPSLFNFQLIADALQERQALRIAADAEALSNVVSSWLSDRAKRDAAGEAGQQFVQENRGAVARTVSLIDRELSVSQ